MDILTLTVLAANRAIVQYRLPDYLDRSRRICRAHAACVAEIAEKGGSSAVVRALLSDMHQIACTTGNCRWCALPLASRPHHALQTPKPARLSKVLGANNVAGGFPMGEDIYSKVYREMMKNNPSWDLEVYPPGQTNYRIYRK